MLSRFWFCEGAEEAALSSSGGESCLVVGRSEVLLHLFLLPVLLLFGSIISVVGVHEPWQAC